MTPAIKAGPPQMYSTGALFLTPYTMPMIPIDIPPKPPTVLTIDLKRFIVYPMFPLDIYFYGYFFSITSILLQLCIYESMEDLIFQFDEE